MVIEIPLSKTSPKYAGKYVALISEEDAELLAFNWFIAGPVKYRNASRKCNNKSIKLHRAVMERVLGRPLKREEFVDHINHNTLDDRRENLRIATISENSRNRLVHSNNMSGYKGIHSVRNKWRAVIKFDKKLYHLGYFNTPEEAHEAYCKKAEELHGEFANNGTRT